MLRDANKELISFLCSLLAIIIALSYYTYRIDFVTPIIPLVSTVGISLFIINSHSVIKWFIRKYIPSINDEWFLSAPTLTFLSFFIVFICGLMNFMIHFQISVLVMSIGFILFLFNFSFVIKIWKFSFFWPIGAVLILGVLIITRYYSGHLSPLILENIKVNLELFPPDFQYHVSIIQMILNYGIPSTGLDGVPFIQYHFGSHIILASFVKLLELNASEAYLIIYPVIFIPLFIKSFLDLSVDLSIYFFKRELKINFIYCLILLFIFIEILDNTTPGKLLGKAAMNTPIIFSSESFNISLLMLFIFASTLLSLKSKGEILSARNLNFYLYFFLPILLTFIGLIKISTIAILLPILGYLFIRLKLFSDIRFSLALMLYSLIFIGCFFLTNDFRDSEGGLSWFYFFTSTIRFPLYKFIPIYFFWLFLAIIVCTIYFKATQNESILALFKQNRMLVIELLLLTALIGLIPGSVLKFDRHNNSVYFSEVQKWVSCCVLLAIPQDYLKVQSKSPAIGFTIFAALIALFFVNYTLNLMKDEYMYILMYVPLILVFIRFNGFIKSNALSTFILVLSITPFVFNCAKNLIHYTSVYMSKRSLSITEIRNRKESLDYKTDFEFIEALLKLDRDQEKRNTLLYIRYYINFLQKYSASNGPMLVPALSGYAMISGQPPCDIGFNCKGYSYEHYRKANVQSMIDYNESNLLTDASKSGFKKIIILDYRTKEIIRIPLTNF